MPLCGFATALWPHGDLLINCHHYKDAFHAVLVSHQPCVHRSMWLPLSGPSPRPHTHSQTHTACEQVREPERVDRGGNTREGRGGNRHCGPRGVGCYRDLPAGVINILPTQFGPLVSDDGDDDTINDHTVGRSSCLHFPSTTFRSHHSLSLAPSSPLMAFRWLCEANATPWSLHATVWATDAVAVTWLTRHDGIK